MYESEVYLKYVQGDIPNEVFGKFFDTYYGVKKMSILHWTEHCTECSMPNCYTTCDLYTPRIDGKCNRFLNGIELVRQERLADKVQILKIQFKKWGVLATQGNNELFEKAQVKEREKKDIRIARIIQLSKPRFIKKKLIQKRYSIKKKQIIKKQNQGVNEPDAFLLEIYNPSSESIYLGFVIRNEDEKFRKIPFQYRIELKPGYTKEIIPFDEIIKRVKVNLPYRINITPENISSNISLYFGILEFVQFKETNFDKKKSKKVKCVIWDLDNTIWNGTLIEDGMDKLELKEGIKEILTEIEHRGIVNSIASKNNIDQTTKALEYFGIKDFFLFPKISWLPKSKSVREIALDLNVNVNSMLFIDDSIFERNEVQSALPQVKIIDAIDYKGILDLPELDVPVTEESKKRKQFYQNEVKRKEQSVNYQGDYFDFLRSCNIKLEILAFEENYIDRIYELTQRTNQMNFSGNRYEKEDILNIAKDQNASCYVLKCQDNFGEYGIIGFGIINKSENRLIDLMFSCRIQSKRVEHAFLTYILEDYLRLGDFYVTYKHTEKNKFSAQVFNDFGFETTKKEGEYLELRFAKDRKIPNDNIVETISNV
ncbi:MAG: HAD-IIIC family phosphatase [Bacteroidales bacterium]|jgi:FkbH-like protein